MLVFHRSKFFISFASFPVSCLMAGSLLAQMDAAIDVSPVFESLPNIEAGTLPVPPRQLPSLRIADQNPSVVNNPFADQFKQAYGEQISPVEAQSKSGLPERPNVSSNLKSWRQPFDGPSLELEQDKSELSWTPPVTDSEVDRVLEGLKPSVEEPVRVARANKLDPNLTLLAVKPEPVNEFQGAGASTQDPQNEFGEFETDDLGLVPPSENTPDIDSPPLSEGLGQLPPQDQESLVPSVIVPKIPAILSNPAGSWDQESIWEEGSPPTPTLTPAPTPTPTLTRRLRPPRR